MSLTPLGNLLGGAAQRAGITRDLAVTHALAAARESLSDCFDEDHSKFAEPISVQRDGALVIQCRSAGAAQTVRLHEAMILERVREAAPSVRVTRLYLVPRNPNDVRKPEADPTEG
jgi:hypothetical protein